MSTGKVLSISRVSLAEMKMKAYPEYNGHDLTDEFRKRHAEHILQLVDVVRTATGQLSYSSFFKERNGQGNEFVVQELSHIGHRLLGDHCEQIDPEETDACLYEQDPHQHQGHRVGIRQPVALHFHACRVDDFPMKKERSWW